MKTALHRELGSARYLGERRLHSLLHQGAILPAGGRGLECSSASVRCVHAARTTQRSSSRQEVVCTATRRCGRSDQTYNWRGWRTEKESSPQTGARTKVQQPPVAGHVHPQVWTTDLDDQTTVTSGQARQDHACQTQVLLGAYNSLVQGPGHFPSVLSVRCRSMAGFHHQRRAGIKLADLSRPKSQRSGDDPAAQRRKKSALCRPTCKSERPNKLKPRKLNYIGAEQAEETPRDESMPPVVREDIDLPGAHPKGQPLRATTAATSRASSRVGDHANTDVRSPRVQESASARANLAETRLEPAAQDPPGSVPAPPPVSPARSRPRSRTPNAARRLWGSNMRARTSSSRTASPPVPARRESIAPVTAQLASLAIGSEVRKGSCPSAESTAWDNLQGNWLSFETSAKDGEH